MFTMDQVKRLFGVKAKEGEKDETATARFESLSDAFPNDPERVKAEFNAGHTVAEAVRALRTQAAADLKAAVDETVTLKAQLLAAQAETAAANKAVTDVKADVAARPAVVVPASGDVAADPGTAFDASKELQAEFGSKAAYLAYVTAAGSGRARILQARKASE